MSFVAASREPDCGPSPAAMTSRSMPGLSFSAKLGFEVRGAVALHRRYRSVQQARHLRTRGVPHVWFVDPEARTHEVLTLDGPTFRVTAVHHGDALVRAQPFQTVELELGALWLPPEDAAP